MKVEVYTKQGKKSDKKMDITSSVFDCNVNEKLLTLAVYAYRSNQRQGNAYTQSRGEVSGGGKKPWAQKGTGRARQGSIRSPIWKGGGVVFGPKADRNYKKKLTKKMKKEAMRNAFSYLAQKNRIVIVEDIDFKNKRLTKSVVEFTNKLPVKGSVLYIHKGDNKNLVLGVRNIENMSVLPVNEINPYILLRHSHVVILKDALEEIQKLWAKEEVVVKSEKKEVKKVEVLKSKVKKVSKKTDLIK